MLSYEDYKMLKAWVEDEDAHRNVKIDVCGYDKPVVEKIWCYDYEIMSGFTYKDGMILPTKEEMKYEKKKELLKQLETGGF